VALALIGAAFAGGTLTGQALSGSSPSERGDARDRDTEALFVYGDSLVVQSEPYFKSVAGALGMRVTTRAAGGIAPCDAEGWLADDLRNARAQVVVFAFSGNSLTDCMRDQRGQLPSGDDVVTKYRTDVEQAALIATQAGVPFVLASPPASLNGGGNWAQLDALYRDIAASRAPYVQYTDAGLQIAPEGMFTATQRCLPFELNIARAQGQCASDGGTIDVRSPDGVHFCADLSVPSPSAPSCSAYSSGAFRYAIALVTAAKLDLDYLATLSSIPGSAPR